MAALGILATIQSPMIDILTADDQMVLLSSFFDVTNNAVFSLNFLAYLFVYITSANLVLENDSSTSVLELPYEIYEYAKSHGLSINIALFKLANYCHLLQYKFKIFISSHSLLAFHKSSEPIRSAVIAIP